MIFLQWHDDVDFCLDIQGDSNGLRWQGYITHFFHTIDLVPSFCHLLLPLGPYMIWRMNRVWRLRLGSKEKLSHPCMSTKTLKSNVVTITHKKTLAPQTLSKVFQAIQAYREHAGRFKVVVATTLSWRSSSKLWSSIRNFVAIYLTQQMTPSRSWVAGKGYCCYLILLSCNELRFQRAWPIVSGWKELFVLTWSYCLAMNFPCHEHANRSVSS